jgi:hypothetical protein
MPKMCSFAAQTCAPEKKKKIQFSGSNICWGEEGGFGVSFIRHRHENWVKLDVYCKHSQIHPWMSSWPNFHKLAIEGLKHLCFLVFWGGCRGARVWCVWFYGSLRHEKKTLSFASRVFFNCSLRASWTGLELELCVFLFMFNHFNIVTLKTIEWECKPEDEIWMMDEVD